MLFFWLPFKPKQNTICNSVPFRSAIAPLCHLKNGLGWKNAFLRGTKKKILIRVTKFNFCNGTAAERHSHANFGSKPGELAMKLVQLFTTQLWNRSCFQFRKKYNDISPLCRSSIEIQGISTAFWLFKTVLAYAYSYSAYNKSWFSDTASSTFLLFHMTRQLYHTLRPLCSCKSMIIPTLVIKRWDTYFAIHALSLPLRTYALRSQQHLNNGISLRSTTLFRYSVAYSDICLF